MRLIIILCILLLSACDSSTTISNNDSEPDTESGDETSNESGPDAPEDSNTDRYQPSAGTTWQWQISGPVNTSYAVDVYGIDLFDSSTDLISELQEAGKKVVCYFSAGSYENWRVDAPDFLSSDLGNTLDDWPGERWLDIRTNNVRTIMQQRLALAKEKGCDAVEPDNVDGYTNNPGFNLTAADQLDYNRYLATEAHALNLGIGLKNNLDQVEELVDDFDFAVNEQCFEYDECDLLTPFIEQNKAVFNAEYKANYINDLVTQSALCEEANDLQFSTLILPLNLDDNFRISCQ